MFLVQAFQNNPIKMPAGEILKGFKVNSPVWQCGVWYQGWTRKGFNLIGFNYLTHFGVNIVFVVDATGYSRDYYLREGFAVQLQLFRSFLAGSK